MPLVAVDGPTLDSAAELMTAAFKDSPLWVYLLSGSSSSSAKEEETSMRMNNMARFFRMYLNLTQKSHGLKLHGSTKTTGELECAFLLLDSQKSPSFWDKVNAGLFTLPFKVGFKNTSRLLRCGSWMDAQFEEVAKGHPVVVLERMVVSPESQGNGIGSRTLLAGLAELSLPCVLSTQLERNVRFYEKLGFKVDRKICFVEDPEIICWFMIREPDSNTVVDMAESK